MRSRTILEHTSQGSPCDAFCMDTEKATPLLSYALLEPEIRSGEDALLSLIASLQRSYCKSKLPKRKLALPTH